MAGFSGSEMCLSQSQPLDQINTFDLLRKRKRGGGLDWEREGGVRVRHYAYTYLFYSFCTVASSTPFSLPLSLLTFIHLILSFISNLYAVNM